MDATLSLHNLLKEGKKGKANNKNFIDKRSEKRSRMIFIDGHALNF